MQDNEMLDLEKALKEARKEKYFGDEKFNDEEDMIAAGHVGNLDLVKHLVDNGSDINSRDEYGRTALMEAIIWKHYQAAAWLLENGARVDYRECICPAECFSGCTAILFANDEQAIDLLLNYGSNIDDICPLDGDGLLHKAVKDSDIDRIKYLLNRNASVDVERQNGESPLMLATKAGNVEIVKLLVSERANVNHRDKIGVSVIQLARLFGHKEIEEFLELNGAIDDSPRLESLEILLPDDYGVDNFFMGAIRYYQMDDGTYHIFFYGTGFTSRWNDLAGCRRIYFCVKNGKFAYHFAGREQGWFHFSEYDQDGRESCLSLEGGSDDLAKNFPDIKKKLKDCKLPPKTILQFKPNSIDGIDIDAEFMSLKAFLSEYVEIYDENVEIPDSNFTFCYPTFRFTEKGADYCGNVTYSESSNYPEELMDIVGSVFRKYFRI